MVVFDVFKEKTEYELRISDWSSDVGSSDRRDGERILPLIAAIIDQSAANAGGQVMPDRIDLWSITRRALQEKHDQRREKSNGHPVINCTHSHHPTQEDQSRNKATKDGKRGEKTEVRRGGKEWVREGQRR